jgi:lysophospholipase L1-like esterase
MRIAGLNVADFRHVRPGKRAGSSLLGLHSRIVYFGDSITANRGFPGYADWTQFLTRGRFYGKAVGSNGLGPTGWNQGVVGNITDQLITRIQNVIDEAPKVVFLLIGTNDIGASGRTSAQVLTNIASIVATLQAAGARVIVGTLIPRTAAGWNGAMETVRLAVNAGIISTYEYVDTSAAITNTATQLQADGTHPNGPGGLALGTVVAAKLATLISTSDILYTSPTAPAENLFLNPFFTGGATVATSWTLFSGANGVTKTASKTTLDGITAQKLVMSGTSTANVADNFNQNVTPAGGLTGELYEAWVEVLVNRAAGISGISLAAGNNTLSYSSMSITSQDGTALSLPFRGVLRAPPSPLLADGGTLNARISFIPVNATVIDAEFIIANAGYRKVPTGQ